MRSAYGSLSSLWRFIIRVRRESHIGSHSNRAWKHLHLSVVRSCHFGENTTHSKAAGEFWQLTLTDDIKHVVYMSLRVIDMTNRIHSPYCWWCFLYSLSHIANVNRSVVVAWGKVDKWNCEVLFYCNTTLQPQAIHCIELLDDRQSQSIPLITHLFNFTL